MDPKPPSGRGFPWLMGTEAVLGRGEGPATPGGDTPAHPGGGLSSALTPPLPGRARGWVFLEEGVMGRARGFLRPSPEAPVGRSAGSEEEEMPALEATPGISRDPGPSLASMFRGLGLDPSRAWGRGAAPVGRAAPASEEQSPGLREESVRFQGRGFFKGRGESPGSGLAAQQIFTEPSGAAQQVSTEPSSAQQVYTEPSSAQQVYTEPSGAAQQIYTEPSSAQQFYTEPSSAQQFYTEPSSAQQISTEPSGAAHQGVEVEKLKERLNKAGSAGTLVDLGSNLVPISCKYELVYQYHVTFTPSVESRGVRFSMMKEARAVTGEVMAFDGSILYLPRRLEEELHFKALRKTDEQEIDVKIQLTKVLPPTSDLCVPFYNVLLRRVMKILGLKLVGRNFYNPDSAVILSKHRLQLWPGFSTCIKQTDGGLYLVADVSHKVLRNDSVLNIMNVLYHESGERFQDDCTKELVGAVILTRYNNCTYRVDNIDWSKSPKDTFTMSNGTVTTFVDYYRNHYGITIKELDQPLLVSRPREKLRPRDQMAVVRGDALLVPELSFMTGIPEKMKKDFRSMKDVTMHTISGPKQHAQSIRKLLQDITASEEARSELERWGLGVGQALLTTRGRILPRETIYMKAVSFPTTPSVDWSREVTRDPPISSVPSDHWVVLYPRRAAEQAQELVSMFSRTAGPLGITLSRPQSVELQDDRTDTYVKSIHTLLTSQPHIQLVVCIVTGTRDDLYGAIKKLCCLQYPVPSQVVNARTISHPHKLRSIAQKILLQINCKLGGELWSVSVPLKQLMVIGVDVHHDISKKSRSVLGFVASLNSSMTRWYSKAYFQMPHEEIISGFRVCLLSALQKYYQVNHSFPGKIVVFRDGVSDGQMKAVEQYEIPQILECFRTVPDCQPKLTFIVVQKRISTNLYSCGADDDDSRNATPGTVLDHTVTNRDWVDFYLMAHSVRQGCALPTHYVTLYNTTGLSPDHLQRLTYKMCHLYWNWPGTIRVPAPCKYAHKLAFLCGQYLHREASGSLSEQLFYL